MIAYEAPDETPIGRKLLTDYHTTTLKTWIGGYRNRPEEWTEARNWYPTGVPGWNDKVILGGYSKHRCNIATGVDDIAALCVLPGATLVLAKAGRLTIDGLLSDPLGMLGDSGLYNAGCIEVQGQLSIRNAALKGIRNHGRLRNDGRIYADCSVSTCPSDWGEFADYGERVFLSPQ